METPEGEWASSSTELCFCPHHLYLNIRNGHGYSPLGGPLGSSSTCTDLYLLLPISCILMAGAVMATDPLGTIREIIYVYSSIPFNENDVANLIKFKIDISKNIWQYSEPYFTTIFKSILLILKIAPNIHNRN